MDACLSEYVKRKLPVIPVLLPGASGTLKLPPFLQRFTWVDLRDGLTNEGLDKLEWGITGRKPGTAETSPPPAGTPKQAPLDLPERGPTDDVDWQGPILPDGQPPPEEDGALVMMAFDVSVLDYDRAKGRSLLLEWLISCRHRSATEEDLDVILEELFERSFLEEAPNPGPRFRVDVPEALKPPQIRSPQPVLMSL